MLKRISSTNFKKYFRAGQSWRMVGEYKHIDAQIGKLCRLRIIAVINDHCDEDNFYGEISHWWPFLKNYRDYIFDNCQDDITVSCPLLVAHWLGCAVHSIQDENFDTLFIPQLANRHFNGDNSQAAELADLGVDMFILAHHPPPLHGDFSTLIPFEDLSRVYSLLGVDYSAHDIHRGVSFLAWFYRFELIAPKFGALFYAQKVPWMYQNYLGAAGGVNDSALLSAAYLDVLWQQLLNRNRAFDDTREALLRTPK